MSASASASPDLELRCINTVRALAIDMIEQANSGHPGMPMAMAPAAYVLYREIMRHDPADPSWPDRDRFVLSAGHGSAWIYAALHLSGYDLSLDDLKAFRQWGSRTPGHPERDPDHVTPGVEVTTGPLGQGFANGVGMAIAERFLREHYGADVQNHHTYAIVSDGDLMEGIAAEAASMAGQLGLGRLVYLYDDNDISLDGPTSLSFDRENVTQRFEAYGWAVTQVDDVNDTAALRSAIEAARDDEERPSLIRVKTVIGYGSPAKQGTSKAHGAPLGADETRAAKQALGVNPDATFDVPDDVAAAFNAREPGAQLHAAWKERFAAFAAAKPELAAEWDAAWAGKALPGLAEAMASIDWAGKPIATRSAGGKAMAAFESLTPTMVGGAADLSGSTMTNFPASERFTPETPGGRNLFYGVREHAMGAAVNGLAAHGGIVRPFGSTFLQFADYMRAAIRLSALQKLPAVWVFTHDSIALGEDGPTHQPVEHIAALRAIPELVVLRPADAIETAEAWRVVLEDLDGPAVLILSRQNLPVLDDTAAAREGVGRGAYVVVEDPDAEATIIGTGAEVHTALAARELLDVPVRVVSMPSWELFDEQTEEYQEAVLPIDLPTVSVEAGISMGWESYSDTQIAVDRFGASAPGDQLLQEYGITAERTAEAVRELLAD